MSVDNYFEWFDVEQWFLNRRSKTLVTSGTGEDGCYCSLMGGGKGSHSAQDSSSQQRITQPEMSAMLRLRSPEVVKEKGKTHGCWRRKVKSKEVCLFIFRRELRKI